ncbi:ephrin type-A receptor 3-like isoform X1 [Hydra vulgaris]|uniref:ephrin type-A receptor 3-like isoform X1 n=1 Tax=Hydra vulgaris TaxID=6087 RepID=UPI001F5E9596|nr:ephrin type-A receptor 3-like isoform X1 [Hydra vulgaris]
MLQSMLIKNILQKCFKNECLEGYYKTDSGNHPCSKCGANVKPGAAPRILCECLPNYHRQIGRDSNEADCFESPAQVENIKVLNITSDQATITWDEPRKGSFELGFYVIQCNNCPSYRNEFPKKTTDLSITVTNLAAYATYKLCIYNENNATNLTGIRYYALFSFLTEKGVPGKITDVTNTSDSDGNVILKWNPPFALGSDQLTYVIEYGDKTERTKNEFIFIKQNLFDKTYRVRIGTEVIIAGKVLSGPDYTFEIKVPGGVSPVTTLGIAAGIIVFVVVVLVASFCIWKKRNPAYLQVVRMEDGTVKLPARFYSGGKLYVDPKTFLLVSDAVSQFAYEIERSEIVFGELIGSGEFADVHKGVLMKEGKKEPVAIKVLKNGASESDREDFLSEAAILGQFSNPNVIFLEGVVLKDEPNLIVLEYMEYGALDSYLKEHDMQFTIEQLLEMARGVASGMKYLSEMGFVHRDLAARNILVNEKKTCKIADFGMSLEIKVEDQLEAKGSKIPVRWTSPEAIQFKKFTTASDVWSYGIVLWEIMSYGERPYWEWSNLEVLNKVNSGYRLPPPMGCPRVVHDLMLNCWEKERSKRPLFSVIRDRIDDWLQIPELLDELGPVVKLDDALDYTIMQTINKWLEAIDMGRYANNFLEQGFATPRQILLLTMDDLEALGIGSLEHRRRIFKAIANTKSQVESNLVRMNSKTGTFKSQDSSK